jgi:CheY-like chemotaxis protein
MKMENVKGLMDVLNGDARNAMHSILGFLELVNEGALNPAQREHIEACRVAVDRHFRGIEDARVILGLTAEERPVITQFAPGDLFGRVAEAVGIIARRKRIGLFCKVEASVPPMVAADLERMGHALLRIAEAVVNTIEGGDIQLNLRGLSSPQATSLSFEILAPSGVIPKVLMPALEQDDFAFDSSLPGSEALGLAAARKLVIALGGRVQATAVSTTGTRITVIIPVAVESGAAKPLQPGATPSPSANDGLRILVAEDSEDSFRLFKAYLNGQPHIVSRALNGAEAVELATAQAFDLVFMDIRMPVMDGYDATRLIREWETGKDRPRLPIVVLSAEDLRMQRRQGALVGCSGHLSKPLRKQELLEAIRVYSKPPSPVTPSPMASQSH